ncbi:MAG: flagellar assembly peptidoglycan hydrolase FlgJ [Gammaproteobacteria bacterium]|nr:flagellar assembly peptidoglycan hydrolase FlgJ [Gammaproteobacteria bacterium]
MLTGKNVEKNQRESVAQQFEQIMLKSMLDSMQDTVAKSELMHSDSESLYQDMLNQHLAKVLAERGTLGFAKIIAEQLPDQTSNAEIKTALPSVSPNTNQNNNPLPDSTTKSPETKQPVWSNPQSFVKDIYPHASIAAAKLNTSPEAIIAVAALETGWGANVMSANANTGNESSYNLFGIKADTAYDGEKTLQWTHEFSAGAMQRKQDNFRAYDSVATAINDFANFIEKNPRYSAALETQGDATKFTAALAQAGYATDPQYQQKLLGILNGSVLKSALNEVKNLTYQPIVEASNTQSASLSTSPMFALR